MTEYIVVVKQDVLICTKLVQGLIVDMQEVGHSQRTLQVWLNNEQLQSLTLILDLIEEELYVDRHPSLYTWELKPYAERQLHRRFPSTEFSRYLFTKSAALPWQTVEGDLWLSGFNEDQILRNLLQWFSVAEVIVTAIHSSMSIWQRVLQKTWFDQRRLQVHFNHSSLVLLVRVSEQDFRQLLFVNGFIRTNRLINLEARVIDEQMPILIQEVNLLEKFARTQKLLQPTQKLTIFYLAREEEERAIALSAFQNSMFSEHTRSGHFTSMQSLIADLNLVQLYDRLLVLTLSNNRLKSDYQPKIVQQVRAVKQGTWALWIIWKVGFLALIGYGVSYVTHQHETDQATQRLAQVKQSQQSYVARYMNYYEIPFLDQFALSDIKATIDAMDAIRTLQRDQQLAPVLVPVSHVLNRHPQVALFALSIEGDAAGRGAEQNRQIQSKASDGRFKQLVLSLTIEVSAKSRLAEKIEQVNQIVSELSSIEPKRLVGAKLTKVPFNVDSGQALKFNLEDGLTSDKLYIPFEVTVQIAYE